MTTMLMLLFLAVYAAAALYEIKYSPGKKNFFDLKDTAALKGLFCIIVVLVHVPVEYQNPIQDGIGSFAYIGVTFFFMASSFGLMYGVEHKPDYIRKFWQKRLPTLLIPALLCNAVDVFVKCLDDSRITFWSFINIGAWVRVLLLYYFVFWVIKIIPEKFTGGGYCKDVIICAAVMAISLTGRLVNRELPLWFVESCGFIYGIILYDFMNQFRKWTDQKWGIKTACIFLLSGMLGVLYIKFKPVDFWGDYCLRIVLGILLMLLILMIIRRFEIGNRALKFLGMISYEVFLIHGTVFELAAFIHPALDSGTFILLSLLITIVFAAIISKISQAFSAQ